MAFFTTFFKQLLSRKERKSSISWSRSSRERKTTASDDSPSSNSSIITSSKEGHNFKYERGRRYHAETDVAYILPNDDDEADRVHQQHWILRDALQCNYYAPVTKMLEEGIKVLDSGCGPATWTFEMGEAFPRSKFYGVDISCVFPESIKPANVEFVICNITKNIPYPDNTFDYIHQRLLFLGLTDEDWDSTLKELYRVLKPGGYIELAELDVQNLSNMGPLLTELQSITEDMFRSRNLPANICAKLEDRVIKAGFVNQVVKIPQLALNHSGKIGELFWDDYKHAYINCRPLLERVHPEWKDDKVFFDYIKTCGKEAKEYKSCVNWYACYAQKPLM